MKATFWLLLALQILTSPGAERSGEEIARLYCQNCHLFPTPNLLDQKTWMTQTLKQMAPFLGVARLDLSRRPDRAILEQANLYPKEPLISREDWFKIVEFYRDNSPSLPLPQAAHTPILPDLPGFLPEFIRTTNGPPMTTLARIDQHRAILADWDTEAFSVFDSRLQLVSELKIPNGPVAIRHRGKSTVLALIGRIFPSDELAGSLVELSDTVRGSASSQAALVSSVPRPVDFQFADFNGDGREDFALCVFGNRLGRFSWFENKGGSYSEHVLLDRPGALVVRVLDANKDGLPDLCVLMGQAREGLFLFLNQGQGNFEMEPLIEEHSLFGSSYFEFADFNGDGSPDILATNGDNGEYPSPMKNYHGVRIYLNDGHFHFKESWFYPLNGAFRAMAGDFNRDGKLDIAAISFFPDYRKSPEESFVLFEAKGPLAFTPRSLPAALKGRWLTMDVGDLDGDGDLDILLGSFTKGPASIPIPADLQKSWVSDGIRALLLRNQAVR